MRRHDRLAFSVLLGAALLAATPAGFAVAAERQELAKVEAIPNSALKKVTLTTEAAERIAIEMQTVREEPVKRWLLVDGEVEAAPGETPSQPATNGAAPSSLVPVRVRVPRLDDPNTVARQTIVVLSLGEDDDDDDEFGSKRRYQR